MGPDRRGPELAQPDVSDCATTRTVLACHAQGARHYPIRGYSRSHSSVTRPAALIVAVASRRVPRRKISTTSSSIPVGQNPQAASIATGRAGR